jgi:hypothetical protein
MECNDEIEKQYGMVRPDWEAGELVAWQAKKNNSHSTNAPQNQEEIRKHLNRISGTDISVVFGFGVSLAQTVIMEVGTDMTRFLTEKHFCSWLGLAPKHDISGGKVLNNKTIKTKNWGRFAWRQPVKKADNPFGVMYRRLITAGNIAGNGGTAHAIARVVAKAK